MPVRRHVRRGLLALSLTILIPAGVTIGALTLFVLHAFLGIGGLVIGLVLLLIAFSWAWATRRGFV
jgi:hypothetical protein